MLFTSPVSGFNVVADVIYIVYSCTCKMQCSSLRFSMQHQKPCGRGNWVCRVSDVRKKFIWLSSYIKKRHNTYDYKGCVLLIGHDNRISSVYYCKIIHCTLKCILEHYRSYDSEPGASCTSWGNNYNTTFVKSALGCCSSGAWVIFPKSRGWRQEQ